jgi:hypothetical protein
MQHITVTQTAHRIKRKRCNRKKMGLYHIPYIFTVLSAQGITGVLALIRRPENFSPICFYKLYSSQSAGRQ